jgi:hypothetical protein
LVAAGAAVAAGVAVVLVGVADVEGLGDGRDGGDIDEAVLVAAAVGAMDVLVALADVADLADGRHGADVHEAVAGAPAGGAEVAEDEGAAYEAGEDELLGAKHGRGLLLLGEGEGRVRSGIFITLRASV